MHHFECIQGKKANTPPQSPVRGNLEICPASGGDCKLEINDFSNDKPDQYTLNNKTRIPRGKKNLIDVRLFSIFQIFKFP